MRPRASPAAGGFTLIEVLIALAIVAIALTATGRATRAAVDAHAEVRDRTYASWVAQNRLNELTAIGAFPAAGTNAGSLAIGDRRFEFRETIGETANVAFRRVEVVVKKPGDERVLARLVGYLTRAQGAP
jgi:general secretion pathway protein I